MVDFRCGYRSTQQKDTVDDLARVENRLKEEAGNYDFALMLAQAEDSDWPEFDRATYVGPIEIRQCEDESIGRGLFLTKDVKAGDLFCERAFSVVSLPADQATRLSSDGVKDLLSLMCCSKLAQYSSTIPAFTALCAGSYEHEAGVEAMDSARLDA